jgi:hypothetical protein
MENMERNAKKRHCPSNNYIQRNYWKGILPSSMSVAQITMIPTPGKPLEEESSYRPINLLPRKSKISEKAMLKKLSPILEENRILPYHHFGVRQKQSTIEQVHQITEIIRGTLEEKNSTALRRS